MQPLYNSVIFAKVVEAIAQTFRLDSFMQPSSRISDDLAIGRFGRWKLIVLLEEQFEIEFLNETVTRFNTLGDIVLYLDRNVRPALADRTRSAANLTPIRHRDSIAPA